MHKPASFATKNTSVGESNNCQWYVGMHPEDHVVPHTSSEQQNLSFLQWYHLPCSHVKPTNNGAILKQLPRPLEIQSYVCLMMFWINAVSQPDINIHISSHIVAINIESCNMITGQMFAHHGASLSQYIPWWMAPKTISKVLLQTLSNTEYRFINIKHNLLAYS